MNSDEVVLELTTIEKVVYIKDNEQVEEKILSSYDMLKIYKSNVTSYVFEDKHGNKMCFAYDKMRVIDNTLQCFV